MSFVVAPLVVAAEEIGPALTDALTAAGHPTTIVDADGLRIVLESDASDTYVIGFGMEGFDGDLRKFLREGPACRSHLIGWWRGLRRFGSDTGGSSGRDDVAGIVLLNVPVTTPPGSSARPSSTGGPARTEHCCMIGASAGPRSSCRSHGCRKRAMWRRNHEQSCHQAG